jgi:hypothetical protein
MLYGVQQGLLCPRLVKGTLIPDSFSLNPWDNPSSRGLCKVPSLCLRAAFLLSYPTSLSTPRPHVSS